MANGDVWLGGYGFWKFRGRPTGVHDPVWVRAMVLNANGTTIATAIVDATGISNRMLKVVPLPAPPWRRVPALAAKRTSPRTARTRPAALPRKSARA